MSLPIVGIACELQDIDVENLGPLAHQTVFAQYLESVTRLSSVCPILVPATNGCSDTRSVAAANYASILDGLVLPGGASNVAPWLYGASHQESQAPQRDPARDATVLPLIRACVAAGIPVLGICRGMQELNVAFGGTLLPNLHETPGRIDHRSRRDARFEDKYLPAHDVTLTPGGLLEAIVARHGLKSDELIVNSLHSQCVDRLAKDMVAEAFANDGTIEAIRHANSRAFAVGVQWHPEWYPGRMPLSGAILREFGSACRERQLQRLQSVSQGQRAAR